MSTCKPYIIAEIGSNCFKYDTNLLNLQCALNQIECAKDAGASAVKFQYFSSMELWGPGCHDQTFAMIQDKYSMPKDWLPVLSEHAIHQQIDFLCSAFSVKGIEEVDPYVQIHKVASPEVCSADIRMAMRRQIKPVIWSMGCHYLDQSTTTGINPDDTVLECVSEYPADPTHYDLNKTREFAHFNSCKWGVSDHTKQNWLAVYARSIGATVFEKHVDFVPDGRETPDSGVSINGRKFKEWALAIRDQPVINHTRIKDGPIERYARRRRNGGWFRPWPDEGP